MRTELIGGPLDGQAVEVPDCLPPVVFVPYLAEAHAGLGLLWDPEPDPADLLRVPCPVSLIYVRDTGLRYRYRG